jgi:hypothetical protein
MAWHAHAICVKCWNAAHPEKPSPPYDDRGHEHLHCCRCNRMTRAGIFVRGDDDPEKWGQCGCGN